MLLSETIASACEVGQNRRDGDCCLSTTSQHTIVYLRRAAHSSQFTARGARCCGLLLMQKARSCCGCSLVLMNIERDAQPNMLRILNSG